MNELNFFLPFLEKKKQNSTKTLYLLVLPAVIGSIIIITFLWNTIYIYSTERDISKINAETNKINNENNMNKINEVFMKYEILTKYNEQIKTIKSEAENTKSINTDTLQDISSKVPKEVKLISLKIDSTEISMGAESSSRTAIAEFQYNLSSLKYISETKLGNIGTSDKANKYSFSISCKLKGGDTSETNK